MQVCVAIVIVITDCHGESQGAMRYARSRRYITERAVAVVAIENVGLTDEVTAGNLIGRTTIGSDAARLPPSVLCQRKFHIVDDVEICVAIVIVVKEGTARSPPFIANACFLRDVGKRSVAIVLIEAIRTEVGDVNIYVTVVVNIGSCAADTVADVAEA